ncbi:MAG: tRNA (N(6)-L-threonylcarbamoyladenosine(37)-C(2))-methylthiotransferase MtaB [Lachnospiraceae bacterium]|nr:tRNA (N(6)-L-threonylcarbamoyladenosine(37)-C(2))-methylthiotransferase MtaB [Lachnospiraceae bacterium]
MRKKPKTIAFHNLGCKVNAYETEIMLQNAQEAGYEIVQFSQISDVYVINTCTVTNIADRKSRQMLHRAKKLNPDSIVVAVGCYVQTGSDALLKDPLVDICIGNNHKAELIPIIEEYAKNRSEKKIVMDDLGVPSSYEDMTLETLTDRVRTFVKIQDGCNQFCTYCAIPLARGRVRSRAKEDICEEIRGLIEKGCSEIVLTGIHVGSYGIDLDESGSISGDYGGKSRLIDLVEEIAKIPGLERIRLSSVEPRIITEENAARLSKLKNLCPHFHLSLQSGCDATLKRMNRHYTADEYFQSVLYLRKYFDDPAITTDVIAGFPGETDEEFEETLAFVKKVGFADMHIFKFSPRKNTKAASMSGKVSEEVKTERSAKLIETQIEMTGEYMKRHIGRTEKVLIEEQQVIFGKKYMIGHTPDYIMTAVSDTSLSPGDVANLKLTGILTEEIMKAEEN